MPAPDRLSAARHFHFEVAELLARVAPSSATVTCIGIANTRAYSYLRSVTGATEAPSPIWTARLEDVLRREFVVDGRAHVLSPAAFDPRFAAADSGGRIAVLALASGGFAHGIVGLERAAGEPELSSCELAELGALSGALSLAASYALMLELLEYEEAVLRAGAGRSSFVALADRSARQVIGLPGKTEVPLSKREREVAQLLVGGYANLNVAAHLGISENTIRTYIRRLYKKLNVCNRIDLIRAYEATI
ncbi:MAG: helix-turn-helix transcriptional regulator [Myxococcota bacterium]|nr:helix-turn-helix transcriptional regulator [Myxococcota bacterium]